MMYVLVEHTKPSIQEKQEDDGDGSTVDTYGFDASMHNFVSPQFVWNSNQEEITCSNSRIDDIIIIVQAEERRG